MKKISLFVVIFIWLVCTANDCKRPDDDCHKTINFVNHSSKDVYIHSCTLCADDFWIPGLLSFQANSLKVKPNEENTSGLWDWNCLESAVTQKDVIVYVFDAEIMETIPRDTIIKYRMVLKTYHPTLEEMENSNWTITYTGE